MEVLEYTENYNGKLFSDCFADLRVYDHELYYPGQKFAVKEKSMTHGTVKLAAVKLIPFRKINDTISFLVMGKPAAVLAARIKADTKDNITPSTWLAYFVCEYISRVPEVQNELWQHWWRNKFKLQNF